MPKSEDDLRDEVAAQVLPLYLQLHTRQVQTVAGAPLTTQVDTRGAAIAALGAAQSFLFARRQYKKHIAEIEANEESAMKMAAQSKNGASRLIAEG